MHIATTHYSQNREPEPKIERDRREPNPMHSQTGPENQLIPCEYCSQMVSFFEYERHLEVNHNNNQNPLPVDLPPVQPEQRPPTVIRIPGSSFRPMNPRDLNPNPPRRPQRAFRQENFPQGIMNLLQNIVEQNEPSFHGLDPSEMESFEKVKFHHGMVREGGYSCPICLENYVEGDTVVYLPCLHFFHFKCILEWTMKNGTCPIDKTDIKQLMEKRI